MISSSKNCWRGKRAAGPVWLRRRAPSTATSSLQPPRVCVSSDRVWSQRRDLQRSGGSGGGGGGGGGGGCPSGGSAPVNTGGEERSKGEEWFSSLRLQVSLSPPPPTHPFSRPSLGLFSVELSPLLRSRASDRLCLSGSH